MTKKASLGVIPDYVMEFALSEMRKIRSGEVIFVVQDGYLMNVEIHQRRRLADWSEEITPWTEEVCVNLRKQISKEFARLLYGRLVIKIQRGRIVQIERTVQHRFIGLDGEGI